MHRIDAPGATPENRFTAGNPTTATPATQVGEQWLNAVQEEIAHVIEQAGDVLDKPDNTQLYTAILSLIQTAVQQAQATTGDVKATFKTAAEAGWVMMNDGTIGSATSGASTRAHADCENLFKLLWANVGNAHAPVSGGRGGSAQADWNANKTIALPKVLGRALAAAGGGSGLTGRDLGQALGAETHQLTAVEMPAHTHNYDDYTGNLAGQVGSPATGDGSTAQFASTPTSSAGGGQAHNNMQPTVFLNFMIKL
jgi:hypothetical protein